MKYEVWDELNAEGNDGDFTVIEADSPLEAAVAYGEADNDGLNDGLYHTGPQPIVVRDRWQHVTRFEVRADLEPVFRATYLPK